MTHTLFHFVGSGREKNSRSKKAWMSVADRLPHRLFVLYWFGFLFSNYAFYQPAAAGVQRTFAKMADSSPLELLSPAVSEETMARPSSAAPPHGENVALLSPGAPRCFIKPLQRINYSATAAFSRRSAELLRCYVHCKMAGYYFRRGKSTGA